MPDLEALEGQLAERHPEEYRTFLLCANGWPSLYMDAKLFGLPELRGEGPQASVAADVLDVYDSEDMFGAIDIPRSDVLPVCAGQGMRTVFVIFRSDRPHAGSVLWLDADEIDRFDGFVEFLASMCDYAND
ncbi:SMI1/KNR4 family protein [Longispora sp. K20-0274]|uniref:SMI1/KNR4 family protein n=1 Tax=Longispora sp. K20-0274 TaxID=3088255 RepID=UPI003999EC0F